MVVRINVSIREGDLKFCKMEDLKPSHLLRDRINQIRDENNPNWINIVDKLKRENVIKQQKLEKAVEHLQDLCDKLGNILTPEQMKVLYGE